MFPMQLRWVSLHKFIDMIFVPYLYIFFLWDNWLKQIQTQPSDTTLGTDLLEWSSPEALCGAWRVHRVRLCLHLQLGGGSNFSEKVLQWLKVIHWQKKPTWSAMVEDGFIMFYIAVHFKSWHNFSWMRHQNCGSQRPANVRDLPQFLSSQLGWVASVPKISQTEVEAWTTDRFFQANDWEFLWWQQQFVTSLSHRLMASAAASRRNGAGEVWGKKHRNWQQERNLLQSFYFFLWAFHSKQLFSTTFAFLFSINLQAICYWSSRLCLCFNLVIEK